MVWFFSLQSRNYNRIKKKDIFVQKLYKTIDTVQKSDNIILKVYHKLQPDSIIMHGNFNCFENFFNYFTDTCKQNQFDVFYTDYVTQDIDYNAIIEIIVDNELLIKAPCNIATLVDKNGILDYVLEDPFSTQHSDYKPNIKYN